MRNILNAHVAVSFISGCIFAMGLGISGMTQPSKVQGFLDVFGSWDPTLGFVMFGAILSHFGFYRWIKGRASPILGGSFSIPTRKDIDYKLILGAAIFGIGWGLGGLCPGPALASLLTLNGGVLIFSASMVTGMLLVKS